MPRRSAWLAVGVVLGAGSSLWAERALRRTVQRTAAAVQPDAVVRQVGRAARDAAEAAGARVAEAVDAGRQAMHRREDELWAGLSAAGHGDRHEVMGETMGRQTVDRGGLRSDAGRPETVGGPGASAADASWREAVGGSDRGWGRRTRPARQGRPRRPRSGATPSAH
ncbi:MAG: hypothetical protein M0040_10310 [Actinomycetota bacterium]|nr:hypothetical protein [Actinomycetota bacterium]